MRTLLAITLALSCLACPGTLDDPSRFDATPARDSSSSVDAGDDGSALDGSSMDAASDSADAD